MNSFKNTKPSHVCATFRDAQCLSESNADLTTIELHFWWLRWIEHSFIMLIWSSEAGHQVHVVSFSCFSAVVHPHSNQHHNGDYKESCKDCGACTDLKRTTIFWHQRKKYAFIWTIIAQNQLSSLFKTLILYLLQNAEFVSPHGRDPVWCNALQFLCSHLVYVSVRVLWGSLGRIWNLNFLLHTELRSR